ncbi:MAG TPA: sulfurtransferase [Gammaproteobacteria bacterium]|nr:sulfurtransferase [Gammaproteobacteria bacterium]
MFDTLIETEVLAAHVHDPKWVVFDCRSVLTDLEAGPRMYMAGHIPGARYLHLERDLSGPVTPQTGRHPLPDPAALAAKLGEAGVGRGTQVAVYDDAGGAIAARLWWLLRWLGHRQVAVLNGGWQQWLKEARPISKDLPHPLARDFHYHGVGQSDYLTTGEVMEMVRGHRKGLLVDARAAHRYRGEGETIDPVAGHVPGTINLPFSGNLGEDGRFHSPAVLRQRFESALGDAVPDRTVFMCGSGVTACHDLLAMELAGMKGARLYAGSWSEWIRDSTRPVAKGD